MNGASSVVRRLTAALTANLITLSISFRSEWEKVSTKDPIDLFSNSTTGGSHNASPIILLTQDEQQAEGLTNARDGASQ